MSQAEEARPIRGLDRVAADPREDLIFTGVVAAILVVFLYFNALNVAHEHAGGGDPVPLWKPLVWEATSGVFFLAVSPLVTALTRRFWPTRPPWLRKIAVHAAAAVLVSLAHVLMIGAARWEIYRLAPLGDWPYELRKDLLVYAAMVAIYVVWRTLRSRAQPVGEASPDVLEVRDGARRHFVPLIDVVWVEAAGNYVELHRGGAGLLHRASLSEMERRLHSAGFVHRGSMCPKRATCRVSHQRTPCVQACGRSPRTRSRNSTAAARTI